MKRKLALTWLSGVLVFVTLSSSCRTGRPTGAPPRSPSTPVPPLATRVPEALPRLVEPVVRIGLATDATRVSIGADQGVVVSFDDRSRAGTARATFVATEAGRSVASRFRVQVASLADEAAARDVARIAEGAVHLPSLVRFNAETRTYQVRVGELESREQAQALSANLRRAGLSGSWVIEDRAPSVPGRLRLVETGQELSRAWVAPATADGMLSVDGAAYRGLIEVRSGPGGLVIVNHLNLEDYLRGVVPNELSPQAFPQIEALKAQAVAARTYALRNRGQFEDQGYDLCATPACQVYRGKSTEQPLSDQAVLDTAGVVMSFQGRPINALYTSTCGGHTEDGENIFEGEKTPYLRGVACLPERAAWTTLKTSAAPSTSLTRDLALLTALGVVDARRLLTAGLQGSPREDELRLWTARLVQAAHRRGCPAEADEALVQRGSFYRYLVRNLCWDERARRLLAPGDTDYLLQVEDRAELTGDGARLAVALLLQEGLLSPFPDNTLRLLGTPTRDELVGLLARAVAKLGAPAWISGEFRGLSAGRLQLKVGEAVETYALAPDIRLFRDLEGSRAAVSEISLASGDPLSLIVKGESAAFLEVRQNRLGSAADRGSRYYRWEVRATPEQLGQNASKQPAQVGRILDVVSRRLGVSGRVIELAVVGTEGELLLRGLKVRSFLGLRENLFVIDRERDAQGQVRQFVFTGKGWGHGVGLCQVGAAGMAQGGASFEQILNHYYSSVQLGQAR